MQQKLVCSLLDGGEDTQSQIPGAGPEFSFYLFFGEDDIGMSLLFRFNLLFARKYAPM